MLSHTSSTCWPPCKIHWGAAGIPDSLSVQEVIFWQGRTIQMMYHIIGQAMQRAGVQDQHPRDYLSFFCLGNPLQPPWLSLSALMPCFTLLCRPAGICNLLTMCDLVTRLHKLVFPRGQPLWYFRHSSVDLTRYLAYLNMAEEQAAAPSGLTSYTKLFHT